MLKCENTIVQNLKNMTSIIRDLPILLQNFPVLGLDLNVHIIGMKPFLNILVGLAEKEWRHTTMYNLFYAQNKTVL